MQSEDQDVSFERLFSPFTTLKAIIWIVVVGLVVYFNSLFNGFVGDDNGLITNNPLVHSLGNIIILFAKGVFYDSGSGQSDNYYKPLVSILYSFLYAPFGPNPFIYHIFQVLLHIANTILVFLIFKFFFKKYYSFLIALIFLVHPINAEAAIYIAALQDALFLFFGLSALYLLIRNIGGFYIFFSETALLTMSVLSKETGIAFLIILPLFNFFFQKRKFRYITQSIIALSIYLFLRFEIAHIFFNKVKVVPIMELSFWERIINVPLIILFYLKTFIFPNNLSVLQAWVVKSINFSDFYLPLILELFISAIVIFISIIIFKHNKNLFRVSIFFFLWFVIGICFHLQIFPLDQTVADRWLYFPILGLLGLIGVAMAYLDTKKLHPLLTVSMLIIICLLSVRTILRNTNWVNNLMLYTHDNQVNQDSPLLERGLGYELAQNGDWKHAEYHYIKATRLFPSENTWLSLGEFYVYSHRFNDAKKSFENTLKYGDSAEVYSSLAIISLQGNDMLVAEKSISNSLKKFPNDSKLLGYLAIAKYRLGNKNEAIWLSRKAYIISSDPVFLNLTNEIQNNEKI